MKRLLLSVLLSTLPLASLAQTANPEQAFLEEDDPQQGPPRWSLGIGAIIEDNGYAGEGTEVEPIPFVGFEGEKFYVRGLTAGWRFIDNHSFELAAIAELKLFDGVEVADLGKNELAANGIDYRLLEDRDGGLDLGLSATWKGGFGELETEILADATNTSSGQEVSLQYSYEFEVGKGELSPHVGAKWLSKDTANYYYGTLDKEVARGVVDYKPDSVVIPSVGVSYFRPVGEKWSFISFADYDFLPDEISNSPLIEKDTDGAFFVFVGFSRGF